MTRRISSPRLTRLLVAALAASGVAAQSASAAGIDVPPGNELFQSVHAVGFQIYTCNSTGTGWTFKAPDARLFDDGGEFFGTHFAGPTWQANDGSTVKGARDASAPSPNPNSIPLLLLHAVTTTIGPDGNTLTPTTFIQRLNTNGGLAPSVPCAANTSGSSPYTADYAFYTSTNAQ
jgi:hypothetical protein